MCRVRQPAYFDNLESTREGSKTLAQCSIASSKSCHLIIRMMLLFCKRGKVNSLSHVQLFVTPWTLAYQASQSVGFSRQQYWSGVPLPSPSIALVSTKYQHELAIGLPKSPPTSLPIPAL